MRSNFLETLIFMINVCISCLVYKMRFNNKRKAPYKEVKLLEQGYKEEVIMTEQQWLDWIKENTRKADVHGPLGKYTTGIVLVTHLSDIVSRLPKKKGLPVIPQFVADYIEYYRDSELSIIEWLTNDGNDADFEEQTYAWLTDGDFKTRNKRDNMLLTAVTVGYEIEQVEVEDITEKLVNHIRSDDFEDILRSSIREFVIKNGVQ